MAYDIGVGGVDHPMGDAEPVFERYELQKDQENFLYDLLILWDKKPQDVYYDYCILIQTVIDKGWYDEEQQYELMDARQLYMDDLER